MKRILPIVLVVLVVAAVIAGGYWLYVTRFAPQSTANQTFTQIVTAKKGDLSNTLSVVGELDSVSSEDLVFDKMDGATELKTLNVATGNTVKVGQVVATIDPAPYEQALDQAKSDLQAAEKKLADLKAPVTDLAKAQADLAAAKADYDLQQAKQDVADFSAPDLVSMQGEVQDAQEALAQLGFDEKLGARDALAKTERDLGYAIDWFQRRVNNLKNQERKNKEEAQELIDRQAKIIEMNAELAHVQSQRALADMALKAERAKDETALADAQKALATAKAGGDPLELAKAQLAVNEAQVALDKAKDDRSQLDLGADPTELAAAQADVDKKKLAVDNAQAALDGTQLKATIDGTVVKIPVSEGDEVTDTSVIMAIADLTQLQVVAAVDETTVRRVSEGQTADISFDAFPGQTFKGKVLAVPLQGELQNDVMVYQVPISIEGIEKLPLLVGMTANVGIETEKVENALLVPTVALMRVPGGWQVLAIDPSKPQGPYVPLDVQVGLSDGQFTQILAGLFEGDQVVVQYTPTTNQGFGNGRFGGGGFGGFSSGAVPVVIPVEKFGGGGGGGGRPGGGGKP